jgi:ABC-type glutathione transport system ATPase component
MQTQGITILYVSHDFEAVQNLCTRAIWLEAGKLQAQGDAREIIGRMKDRYHWDGQQKLFPEASESQATVNEIIKVAG